MKNRFKMAVLLLTALVLFSICLPAQAEIGFAEVRKDRVNFRKTPGGERITYLNAPQSVFVAEEKTIGDALWCRVYTYVGKYTTEGWIRADMLRGVSEEFTGVISVQAGESYVTGLRADGTIAIMGNDMPHMPCVDEVRSWGAIRQVTSGRCAVYALDRNDNIFAVGRNTRFGAEKAGKLCGNEPILLDEDGWIMRETWDWNEETAGASDGHLTDAIRGFPCIKAVGHERQLYAALTEDGEMICVGQFRDKQHDFVNGPYIDADAGHAPVVALRADGRVDAAARWDLPAECIATEGWEDVIKVAAGDRHLLGLRADGTVYYAGDDGDHAWQVACWTDVVDVDAGSGYSIALKADGSVVMAGVYTDYFR